MRESIAIAEEHMKVLHSIPEPGLLEFKTSEHIREFCDKYPLSYVDFGLETGLAAYLDAGCESTIALRADIDALQTEHGAEHLCGHDSHTATMMGALHYLCSIKDSLKHNILFVFQPAEEGTRGAEVMVENGLFRNTPVPPCMMFGIHNRPEKEVGKVVVHKVPLMSAKSLFDVTFTGKSGHSSTPHKCIDPIVTAAEFITGVQSIVGKNADPFEPCICSVTAVNAGDRDTPMADSAEVNGFIRSFDHETHMRLEERIERLAISTAEAYECGGEVELTRAAPALINSDEMYEIAYKAIETALGADCIIDSEPCLASEDFAFYTEYIPTFFYWVGSGEPGCDNAPWHNPNFRVGEGYFKTAVPVLTASALI